MPHFNYEFEELPLHLSAPRIEAGYVNGCADIRYSHDGLWEIESICLEGYKHLSFAEHEAGKRPWVYVEAPEAIASIIHDRLTGEWRDKVREAVSEQIESDREVALENWADMRREREWV